MPTDHRAALAKIKRFDQLIAYLRDEMGWPIARDSFEDVNDLFYDFTAAELGIDALNAAKIQEIKRLRPLSSKQPWGIFFVKFEPKSLPVVALRRILSQVALKKRPSANSAERAAWAADDLLFISNYGEGDERQISFAHFSRAQDGHDLPTLKVLGWDNLDTALHLDNVAKELSDHLAWPDDDADVEAWRTSWRAAFNLRHREVVTTSQQLSIRLAELARAIRDRIKAALAIETEAGPLTKLMKAFQEALVHDLDADGFADMYAQTITYGLLSARIADPAKKTTDDFAAHMRTNPFLRELMETFLHVGGRRGKAGGPGIDFDELGVSEVVQLLDDANMEAVVRDFGDRNPQEDPVIHFYELFLKEYDAKKRMQRGVFYTPRPVVSYIVRSVDELLRVKFGLEDGLADTSTWADVTRRHQSFNIPEGVSADQDFVQILDPAAGTGTFLVEVIDVIHKTLIAKWRARGYSGRKIEVLWNEYVPKHLLPRLHGYELLMAPYAIAHLKIGLKLYETGYRFDSEERARVYLTNALEPAYDLSGKFYFAVPALAHEAQAVNAIKRNRRFTVIIGNPPYSVNSANKKSPIDAALVEYKKNLEDERNLKPLNDDYVKFIRFAHLLLLDGGRGIVGMITNHSYATARLFRSMRHSLLSDFQSAFFLDLRGDMNRDPGMLHDDNVFDIQQGVGIGIYCRTASSAPASLVVQTHELRGARSEKSDWLSLHSYGTTNWTAVTSASELFSFLDLSGSADNEYRTFVPLNRFFELGNVGYQTHRDEFVIDLDRKDLIDRLASFGEASGDEAQLAKRFGVRSNRDWSLLSARKSLKQDKHFDQHVVKTLYRPFDIRHICYVPYLIDYDRHQLMDHMQRGNVGLLVSKVFDEHEFTSVLVTRWIVESKAADRTRGSYLFPLRLIQDSEHLQFEGSGVGKWRTNLQSEGAFRLTKQLGVDLQIGDVATESGAITDIQVLNYIYAILHSPSYRLRYIEFLKSDFPRIPIPQELKMLHSLVVLGGELTDLHLLEATMLENPGVVFVGKHPLIEKVSWSHGTVWLDKNCTVGFENVPMEVWGFHVGGYNVCEKWLKDRKGRVLSKKDVIHYQKIVAALEETIRVMKKIDEVIETYGGWSAAFVQDDGTTEGALVHLAHPESTGGAASRKNPSQLLEAAEPEVPPYEAAILTDLDAIRPNPDELDREELICRIRQWFGDGNERERATAIDELARDLGYQRTGNRIHEELDNALRTAVRRRVLASEPGTVRLFARAIEQYDRDFLKEQFLACLLGRQWVEREDATRAFARWMGFRRVGPAIGDTARSLINGLLREDRLESDGSQIRRSS